MRRIAGIVVAVLLGACAPLQTRPAHDEAVELRWAQRSETLAMVEGFSLQGRITQARGSSGSLRWQQRAHGEFDLQLSGPFGAGAISMRGTAAGVEVRSKEGTQFTPDPQRWMLEHLGWTLPLDSLGNWALGIPASGPVESYRLDDAGQLIELQQNQWTVRFDRYQTVGSMTLPGRIEAEQGDISLRLVVDRWEALDLAARP